MATPASPAQRVDLLGTVQVLQEHLTTSLCQTVFQQTRPTERERRWSLAALASFWTAVILRAPQSLAQAMEEAATGNGAGGPRVPATPEAFFERGQTLHWRCLATRYEALVAPGLPQATPSSAAPLHPLRERCMEVWSVDGARWEAVAHRRKLRREVRARVLPGCVTAFYDVSRGITRRLDFTPDAAAGALPRATAALTHLPQGPVLVGDRLDGVGAFLAALTSRGLAGLGRRHGCQRGRWLRE